MRAKNGHGFVSPDVVSPSYTIDKLLRAGQYQEIDRYLARLGDGLEQASLLADIVEAARQLCQVCRLSRDTADWHRRASEEAAMREKGLAELLLAIYDTVVEYTPGTINKQPEKPAIIDTVVLRRNGRDSDGASQTNSANLTLWQRIHNLLSREANSQSGRSGDSGTAMAPGTATTPEERAPVQAEDAQGSTLVVFCLGQFRAYLDDELVENWPGRKYKSVFKYLVTHHARPVAKEVLMELFWPDSTPDSARNNLNVVICGLRQTLREVDPSFSHILFQDDCYLFNPALRVWVDAEAFAAQVRNAQKLESKNEILLAIKEYSAAETLYQGEFFEEDRYEDWLTSQRQTLQVTYLDVLDRLGRHYLNQSNHAAAATIGKKILSIEPCHEGAHRCLMDCYYEQGQPHLALRQYHLCAETLRKELNISPSPNTVERYQQILASVMPQR